MLNNKKRKLQFIRYKNLIRSGIHHGYASLKVLNKYNTPISDWRIMYAELKKQDPEYAEQLKGIIDRSIKSGWKSIKRKWKLKFEYSHVQITSGFVNDDFQNNLYTIQIQYFK